VVLRFGLLVRTPLLPTEEAGAVRPGASQRQLTADNVYELRQISDAGEVEQPPHSRHLCAVTLDPFAIMRLADARPELENFDATTTAIESVLANKDRTRAIQLDSHRHDRHQWQGERDQDEREQKIAASL
jgi:hypothetical protein